MIMRKNYAASHKPFVVSSKRIELSPYLNKYNNKNIILGISAKRFYPLSTEVDPTASYWILKKNVMLYDEPQKPMEISGPY